METAMTRKKNDPQDLEKELRGLKNILSVAQVVVSSLRLEEVLDNILGSAMAVMEMPAGSIALYDRASNYLSLKVHHGLSENFISRDRWRVGEGGLTATILNQGTAFAVEDTDKADFFNNPLAVTEGIRALIAVPLKIQNKVIGILYVDDFKPRRFDQMDLRLLSILGSFAAMSIDNARLHEKTRRLASTDGLTGLYNHRQFKRLFSEELMRARRYRKPLGLVMLDVDDFKHFNDSYGHPVGDKVLVAVAEILTETLRDCDYIFRYGGEEFIALLPESDAAASLAAAERCRALIEQESARYLDGFATTGVTVSIGVATYPRDGETFDGLLKVVDDLLYAAKREGKNKIHYLPDS
ncbi:GGDEF domain-containing protein [Geothermobacter hydrogeniphilus]|uniref:diguanylate cyclase n=2 Tax=Geothermobacter hydrogeniphilus TaxID=1969733 RepID=A0A1X0Y943_9BACT|nr:GGDEF domain-containing protein [Geothermobacter hydrogeniphilus]